MLQQHSDCLPQRYVVREGLKVHVLFIHQNFPAQFGHIASYLVQKHGYRCTFVSQLPPGMVAGVERIRYELGGGATRQTHYCSRTFENQVWHMDGVYRALRARPDIRPDLIVGHSGLGGTLFLRELYGCPIINYFEYYYHTTGCDMDFRPDFPCPEVNRLRARARNAMLLLDLENCDLSYSPTYWQRDRFPKRFHDKLRVIFDGIDTSVWKPAANPLSPGPSPASEARGQERRIRSVTIPGGTRLVTYVSRGMESMRGFDIFMKVAKRLCDRRKDVLFIVVGQDRVCYGGDERVTGNSSFKEWVLAQDDYDLSRFLFLGLLPPVELARLLALSDLHIYLTVPFVLSWSLMNALACGATVLASDTPPVREIIEHGRNGLLAGFFDLDELTETADRVLNNPEEFRHLGVAGVESVRQHYSLEVCFPKIVRFYEEVAGTRGRVNETNS